MYKKKKAVTCSQAAKWILPFMKGEMKMNELEQFIHHIEDCDACKEELSIQYLVTVGLDSLENSNNFDLQSELAMALDIAHKKVRTHQFLLQTVYCMVALGIFGLVAGVTVWMIW